MLQKTRKIKKRLNDRKPAALFLAKSEKLGLGWQEWCSLPKLHVPAIKIKIDTGAKTSALHAWDIRSFHKYGELYVHFILHPLQRNTKLTIHCSACVYDRRYIMNSSGDKELRYIIRTPITLGGNTWNIEISLTNRDSMAFRMLLGRDALKGHALIDPGKTLRLGELKKRNLKKLYAHKFQTTSKHQTMNKSQATKLHANHKLSNAKAKTEYK